MKWKGLSLKSSKALALIALILIVLSTLWYGNQLIRFGLVFDHVDLMGLYFIMSIIALVSVLKSGDAVLQTRFIFIICTFSTIATILFFGQFMGTFGGVYNEKETIYFDIVRMIMFLAATTTMLALKPNRHFIVPKYLLVIVGCAAAYWVFVYAFPSIVREWYGTRSAPSKQFPDGILLLTKRNPERDVQKTAFIILMIVWFIAIAFGRYKYCKAHEKEATAEPQQ